MPRKNLLLSIPFLTLFFFIFASEASANMAPPSSFEIMTGRMWNNAYPYLNQINSSNFKKYMLAAVAMTILIEGIVAFAYASYSKLDAVKIALTLVIIDIFTVSLLWILSLVFSVNIFIMEVVIFLVEAVLLKAITKISYKEAFTISFLANFMSFVIGYFILYLPMLEVYSAARKVKVIR